MPGFRAPAVVYQLDFEDTILDGLVVMMRSVSLQRLFDLQDLVQQAAGDTAAAKQLIGDLAGLITSWNLEDDQDQPVPVGTEGLMALDARHLALIVQAYQSAMTAAPKASPNGSSDGGTSLERSIPMDVSSPNPAS